MHIRDYRYDIGKVYGVIKERETTQHGVPYNCCEEGAQVQNGSAHDLARDYADRHLGVPQLGAPLLWTWCAGHLGIIK